MSPRRVDNRNTSRPAAPGSKRWGYRLDSLIMSLTRRPVVALLIAAVIVHAGVLVITHVRTGSISGYAFQSLDCGEYFQIAQNVARHGTFSQSTEVPLEPDTWRTPGYPLFLSAFMVVLGDSPGMLIVVQQLLSILNVILVFGVARHWMSPGRAMVAAGLFLLEPYHLFYSLWLMASTLFVTVLLLIWLVWTRACRTRHWKWFALLGISSGTLVLVRPIGVFIPIALMIGIIINTVLFRRGFRDRAGASSREGGRGSETRAVHSYTEPLPHGRGSEDHAAQSSLELGQRIAYVGLATFVLACAVVIGSWMLRNKVVAGHFALSDQGGVVLAYFKASEVVLWKQGRQEMRYAETSLDPNKADRPHTVWDRIDERLRDRFASLPEDQRRTLKWQNLAQGNRTDVDSFALSRALGEIGRSDLVSSPGATVICCLVRCGSILTFPLNLALRPPEAVPLSRWRWGLYGSIYLMVSLMVLVKLILRRVTFYQVFFPLSCTIALLVATTPQIDPRFRVPMVPLLLIIAFLPTSGRSTSRSATSSR